VRESNGKPSRRRASSPNWGISIADTENDAFIVVAGTAAPEQEPRRRAAGGARPCELTRAVPGAEGMIHVFDVWESMEQFQQFGATLLPILENLDPGQPHVATVHNLQEG
jgi:hypothetical protein